MWIKHPEEGIWDATFHEGECEAVVVFTNPSERVSELLGPDGEPLMVPYPRPKLGFDLTPKKGSEQ